MIQTPYGIRSEITYRPGKPVRDPEYLRFVRSFPCLVCRQAWRIEAHHFGSKGIGQKPSDFNAVPLCRKHHREAHQLGPVRFQEQHRLDIPSLVVQLNELYREKKGGKAA